MKQHTKPPKALAYVRRTVWRRTVMRGGVAISLRGIVAQRAAIDETARTLGVKVSRVYNDFWSSDKAIREHAVLETAVEDIEHHPGIYRYLIICERTDILELSYVIALKRRLRELGVELVYAIDIRAPEPDVIALLRIWTPNKDHREER